MLKILIVEDDQEKRRIITQTVMAVEGLSIHDFTFASDVVTAKKEIKKNRFDLVVLDINLPERADGRPAVGAGLDVLHFIKNSASAKTPACLVGLTAYDDGAAAAQHEFLSPLWKLLRFSYQDVSWQQPLKEAVSFLLNLRKPPYVNDGHNYHTDLGIFAALDEELESVLKLDGNWATVNVPYDHARYYEGTFQGENGKLNVVATVAPHMGMPSAAVSASKLIHTFRPRFVAIIGICAGVRGKSEIGDILIADPCFDWGSGKWVRDDTSKTLRFRPAPYQWRLDEPLRASARSVASAPGLLSRIHQSYGGKRPVNQPRVLIDAMASGASVLQAASLMEDVRDQHKNLVGIEMESYAVFSAAQHAAEPRPQCISIKSVCDFGDEDKADDFHEYAAHTSTQFLYELALNGFAMNDN